MSSRCSPKYSSSSMPPAKPRELSKFPMITGIQHRSSAGSSTLVLNLEDKVRYEGHRLNVTAPVFDCLVSIESR